MKTIYIILIVLLIIIYLFAVIKYQMRVNNELIIQQVDNPNYEQIENIVNSRNPAILTGLIENIKELYEWEPSYFKKKFPDEIIKVQKSLIEQSKTEYINITLSKYIDFIENKKDVNYYSWCDSYFLNKHKLDKPINDFFSKYLNDFKEYHICISPDKYRKGLHCNYNNLSIICQVYGQKSIFLFNPDQTKYLYPNNKLFKNGKLSSINFWDTELHKNFPLFKEAKYIEVKLSPGQLFIIPPYWWYCYETIDVNIDFSYIGDTLFHKMSNVSQYVKTILHNCGLYKTKNCTCCNL